MNAADYYGLDELRRACAGFVQCCITVDTVCALLASAERYIQYKCTKSLVQKVCLVLIVIYLLTLETCVSFVEHTILTGQMRITLTILRDEINGLKICEQKKKLTTEPHIKLFSNL